MNKRIISIMLVICMLLALPVFALAADEEEDPALKAADHLHDLGLFAGRGDDADGKPNYDLGTALNRAEALVMLIRLLGEEEEALACTAETPFTDIGNHWAKSYIAYAYSNGYTNGMTLTTFVPAYPTEAKMYLTLVLRALGYTSGADFEYQTAWDMTDALGITHGEYNAETNQQFLRGDVAIISDSALYAKYKGESMTLLERLIEAGAVTLPESEPEPLPDESEGLVLEVASQSELSDALNRTEKVAEIRITGEFTVTEPSGIIFEGDKLEAYAKTILTIEEGATLTVGDGGEIGGLWFTYEGDWETGTVPDALFFNKGTLIVDKNGWVNGQFDKNDGKIIVRDGGQCQTIPTENFGEVMVESGGSFRTGQGGEIRNEGTIMIAEGANLVTRFGSRIINKGTIEMNGLFAVGYMNTGSDEAIWFRNEGTITGSGTVRVYDVFNEDSESEHADAMVELVKQELGDASELTVVTGIGTGV